MVAANPSAGLSFSVTGNSAGPRPPCKVMLKAVADEALAAGALLCPDLGPPPNALWEQEWAPESIGTSETDDLCGDGR